MILKSGFILFIVICYCIISSMNQNLLLAQEQLDSLELDQRKKVTYNRWDTEIYARPFLCGLPIRGKSSEYYELFTGINKQDFRGTYFVHARGSRNDELGYMFEGINGRSAYSGLNLITFIPELLENLTFNGSPAVSDGNSIALIEHRLKRPGNGLTFTVKGESDNFTPQFKRKINTYSYGYSNLLFMAEGPVYFRKVGLLLGLEFEQFDDHYRKFWDGFRLNGSDYNITGPNWEITSLEDLTGDLEVYVKPGNIPDASSKQFTVNGMVTADFDPVHFKTVVALNQSKTQQNITPIRDLFNTSRIPEKEEKVEMFSIQSDYLGPYDIQAHIQYDFLRANSEKYDPVLKDQLSNYQDQLRQFSIEYFPFSVPGDILSGYFKFEEKLDAVSGNLQKSIAQHHFILGGNWEKRSLRRFETYTNYGSYVPDKNALPEELLRFRNFNLREAYGYDLFGKLINQSDEINDGPRRPQQFGLYLEDYYKTPDLILRVGLRYDNFYSDAWVFKKLEDIYSQDYYDNVPYSEFREATKYHKISPRFNSSYQISDMFTLFLNFGHYYQQARLQDIYGGRAYLIRELSGGYYSANPKAFDSKPVQNSQVVFGTNYRLSPLWTTKGSVFMKTGQNYLEANLALSDPYAIPYYYLENKGKMDARGIELNLNYRKRGTSLHLNYTYSDVSGTSSYPISNLWQLNWIWFLNNSIKSWQFDPIESNQKHRFLFYLSHNTLQTKPKIFNNLQIDLLLRFNSGHNFTVFNDGCG